MLACGDLHDAGQAGHLRREGISAAGPATAELAVEVRSPSPDGAVVAERTSGPPAARDIHDVIDQGRPARRAVEVAVGRAIAEIRVPVQAPRPQAPITGDRVAGLGRSGDPDGPRDPYDLGGHVAGLGGAIAELAIDVPTPGPHRAVSPDRKRRDGVRKPPTASDRDVDDARRQGRCRGANDCTQVFGAELVVGVPTPSAKLTEAEIGVRQGDRHARGRRVPRQVVVGEHGVGVLGPGREAGVGE